MVKTLDAATARATAAIGDLEAYTEFHSTVVAAQTDRDAFSRLEQWSESTQHRFSTEATEAHRAIIAAHNTGLYTTFKVPWKEGLDPSSFDFRALSASFWATGDPVVRLALLQYIYKRNDITRHEKLSLAADVLQKDNNLPIVAMAGRIFSGLGAPKVAPLAIERHLDWWSKNKDEIKD